MQVALNLYKPISGKKVQKFEDAIQRLKNHEPIQYIIGHTEFYGLPIKVTPNTLIPRPETEELVQWVLNTVQGQTEPLTILDVGTGSGCIAIALAKNLPTATVYGLDVSAKALTVAKNNAKRNAVAVTFLELNILDWQHVIKNTVLDGLKWDIIVSNPPYVRFQEQAQMHPNVLAHEPALALFVANTEPLVFYKKIAEFAASRLKLNGRLFFEINQYLGPEMLELLKDYTFKDVELKKDIFGNDRMTSAAQKF